MYRQIVGNLIYLTLTRPNIIFRVRVVSRFMQTPKKPHLEAVRKILRYIKRTLDLELFYKSKIACRLEEYCDVDYAGDYNT